MLPRRSSPALLLLLLLWCVVVLWMFNVMSPTATTLRQEAKTVCELGFGPYHMSQTVANIRLNPLSSSSTEQSQSKVPRYWHNFTPKMGQLRCLERQMC
jgi:hypothetical protein